eukprot:scaffold14670_cov21-Tisochrysis_lutea.AAC.1
MSRMQMRCSVCFLRSMGAFKCKSLQAAAGVTRRMIANSSFVLPPHLFFILASFLDCIIPHMEYKGGTTNNEMVGFTTPWNLDREHDFSRKSAWGGKQSVILGPLCFPRCSGLTVYSTLHSAFHLHTTFSLPRTAVPASPADRAARLPGTSSSSSQQ